LALIDLECTNGHVSENTYRPAKDWQTTPPCPECGAPTERIYLPPRVQWTVDPVVVYQAPDGTIRFPGAKEGLSNKSYERKGFQRIEIRGAAEMRRFEKHMNVRERSIMARKVENQQRAREHREQILRGELRQQMQSMTRRGRDLARAAMRMNDNKPREHTKDANFISECYSFDHSNREEYRGSDGRRGRD